MGGGRNATPTVKGGKPPPSTRCRGQNLPQDLNSPLVNRRAIAFLKSGARLPAIKKDMT